jgi:hypothetical protein
VGVGVGLTVGVGVGLVVLVVGVAVGVGSGVPLAFVKTTADSAGTETELPEKLLETIAGLASIPVVRPVA